MISPCSMPSKHVTIVGAGVLGLSAAMHLSAAGRRVVVVDPRTPMSLTSARSTESYRNFFDTPEMVKFMSRSIDGMEKLAKESDNVFAMTRRGYLFVSEKEEAGKAYKAAALDASRWGAGPLREHSYNGLNISAVTYEPHPTNNKPWQQDVDTGFDLLAGSNCIQRYFPYLSPKLTVALHARRAGWLNAHLYGQHLREKAQQSGVEFVQAEFVGADWKDSKLVAARVKKLQKNGSDAADVKIATDTIVNASGPFLQETHRRICGAQSAKKLPVSNELHAKISFVVPPSIKGPTVYSERVASEPWRALPLGEQLGAHAPMVILSDAIPLPGIGELDLDDDEHTIVMQPHLRKTLKGLLPAGLHFRPYGKDAILALWEFMHTESNITEPPSTDLDPLFEPLYPEVVQLGLARLVPDLAAVVGKVRSHVDGGYYLKAVDKLPVIGPADSENLPGVFICGGLGGQGIMGSFAAGELLAQHVSQSAPLPSYASILNPERFLDPAYVASIDASISERSSTLGSLRANTAAS